MPWTYRRSKRIAPGVRLNLGRRGGSVSAGGKIAGASVGRRGISQRVSVPGTGLSYRSRRKGCGLLLLLAVAAVLVVACGSSATSRTPSPVPVAIPAASATLAPAAPPASGAKVNTGANLRAGPGTNYGRVGGLRAGSEVEVVGRNAAGDWLLLASGAWIAASLVDGAPDGLPVAQAAAAPAAPTARGAPSAAASNCPCDRGDTLNCADFARDGWDAQSCYLRCKELAGKDVHRLDGDADGDACEWQK